MTEVVPVVTNHENAFFDPHTPDIRPYILGVPTDPIIGLSEALGKIATATHTNNDNNGISASLWLKLSGARRNVNNALSIFPLIEMINDAPASEPLTPSDIRPYRKPIKRLIPKLSMVDRLAAATSIIGIGVPFRRYLNRRVEKEAASKLPGMLSRASEQIDLAEPFVRVLEETPNPKQQLINEVDILAENIRDYARQNAERRGDRSPVMADDAAIGIKQTFDYFLTNRDQAEEHLPLLTGMVMNKIHVGTEFPSNNKLGVIAPEIMNILESILPSAQRDKVFMKSILDHPHHLRSLALRFKKYEMEALQMVAPLLLPNIGALLPTSGSSVRKTFNDLKKLLSPQK